MKLHEISRRLNEVHNGKVRLVEETYTGFKERAKFIDSEYGGWWSPVYAVCRGTRHPKRAQVGSRVNIEDLQAQIDDKFGPNLIQVQETGYQGINKPCVFLDSRHGIFTAYPQNVLRGLGHPQQAKDTKSQRASKPVTDVEKAVITASNGMVKLIGSYGGMLRKCLFLDSEFGEFSAYPVNVIHHKTRHPASAPKQRETAMFERFGVRHHMQDADQALKVARSQTRHSIEKHWKTGEELTCVASYEVATVAWWNKNRVNFLWQPQTFLMPDGHTYRPDAYLIDQDLWVEIKGYFRPAGRKKWRWFHREYSNSELWDKRKLQRLGIL